MLLSLSAQHELEPGFLIQRVGRGEKERKRGEGEGEGGGERRTDGLRVQVHDSLARREQRGPEEDVSWGKKFIKIFFFYFRA